MTIYDVTIHVDERDAPGLKRTTDAIYDAMIRAGCRDGYLEVDVHGPPKPSIGVVYRCECERFRGEGT